jgi:hypothetical protein
VPALTALGVQVVAVGRGADFEDQFDAVAGRNSTFAYHADASEAMAHCP